MSRLKRGHDTPESGNHWQPMSIAKKIRSARDRRVRIEINDSDEE